MRRLLLMGVLVSLVISAATGIYILLLGEFGDTQRNLLISTVAVGGFSLTGLASTVGVWSRWLWLVRPLGLATSIVGLGVALLIIWDVADHTGRNLKVLTTLALLAFSAAHVTLLGSFLPANFLIWLWRSGTMLAAVGLAYLIIGGIWGHIRTDDQEYYFRWIGVIAILDVLGTIGLLPLSHLARTPRGPAPQGRRQARRRLRPSG